MMQHFLSVTKMFFFFCCSMAECKPASFCKCYIFIPLCHSCRILHLAIIHEEEFIAQQLIQIFPKDVLDIQNNLYQVSVMQTNTLQLVEGFFDPN